MIVQEKISGIQVEIIVAHKKIYSFWASMEKKLLKLGRPRSAKNQFICHVPVAIF